MVTRTVSIVGSAAVRGCRALGRSEGGLCSGQNFRDPQITGCTPVVLGVVPCGTCGSIQGHLVLMVN